VIQGSGKGLVYRQVEISLFETVQSHHFTIWSVKIDVYFEINSFDYDLYHFRCWNFESHSYATFLLNHMVCAF
jgi:hypothetical protein